MFKKPNRNSVASNPVSTRLDSFNRDPYTVFEDETDRSGALKCPQCGTKLSPNELRDTHYRVVDSMLSPDMRSLRAVVLECRCGAKINLVFPIQQQENT